MVARVVRDDEVAGSIPVTPTSVKASRPRVENRPRGFFLPSRRGFPPAAHDHWECLDNPTDAGPPVGGPTAESRTGARRR